jgi:formylglycine-generating enzyme required for sulfatase activity
LLRILDSEIRLITPTDPEGKDDTDPSTLRAGAKYYQLTHDYLVPSLRDWLTGKQKETRRGRAELLLADRAAVWNARPENRQLPSLVQWLQIRWYSRKKTWTPPQRKMMGRAGRFHALRGSVLALLLAALAVTGLAIRDQVEERRQATHAAGLVQAVLNADTTQTPGIIEEMAAYRPWTDPLLRAELAKAPARSRERLHVSLALLPVDASQVEYLYDRLLEAEPHEVPVLRDALVGHQSDLVERLWPVVEKPKSGKESARLRAAAALARYDAGSPRWGRVAEDLSNDLVRVPALHLAIWMRTFQPVGRKLRSPLGKVFRDGARPETERERATDLLADYAANEPRELVELLLDADAKQFAVLYPKLQGFRDQVLPVLAETVSAVLEEQKTQGEKERLGRRQANAAVLLVRLGQPEQVWPLLKHPARPQAEAFGFSDPRVRSYLIHRFGPLGAEPAVLVRRLDEEKEVSIRRALLLSLGAFGPAQLPAADRERVLPKVVALYREDADAGIHGAAEWLLRQWGQQEAIRQFEEEWVKDEPRRKEREDDMRRQLARAPRRTAHPSRPRPTNGSGKPSYATAVSWFVSLQPVPLEEDEGDKGKEKDRRTFYRGHSYWYVNGQGQTMVVIPGPVEFLIGSPPTEEGRAGGPEDKTEQQVPKRIGRPFAIAAKEVTLGQFTDPEFQKFYKERVGPAFLYNKQYSPTPACPVNNVSWYEAAAYCNWLSAREGLPEKEWCYVPGGGGKYGPGMRLARGYLKRTGYRLPSEAEWEYACRAGALTARPYGETDELLAKYAWYTKNALDRGLSPGYQLQPNDFGLFDMLGNAIEWCQDPAFLYVAGDDNEFREFVGPEYRVLRGGSFGIHSGFVRSADRFAAAPANRYNLVGFRPARTFR